MPADWGDLRIFLTLARERKLAAAARKLGISHPTVARRVKALEQAIGARLFDRLPDHFVLTAAGEELMADVQSMENAADSIHRRSAGLAAAANKGTVRLSAGEAMTAFIARHLPRLRRNLQCIEIELDSRHLLANLSRREADLMIREQVPDLASIVARKLGHVAHAVYGGGALAHLEGDPASLRAAPWAGFDDIHNYMPGQRWMFELLDEARPAVRVNNWLVLHEAAAAGAGLAVLPCYLGDGDPRLRRIGPLLPKVTSDQWLLVHDDLRSLPRVRAVMDVLVQLFQEERAALEGRGAARPPEARPGPTARPRKTGQPALYSIP